MLHILCGALDGAKLVVGAGLLLLNLGLIPLDGTQQNADAAWYRRCPAAGTKCVDLLGSGGAFNCGKCGTDCSVTDCNQMTVSPGVTCTGSLGCCAWSWWGCDGMSDGGIPKYCSCDSTCTS